MRRIMWAEKTESLPTVIYIGEGARKTYAVIKMQEQNATVTVIEQMS